VNLEEKNILHSRKDFFLGGRDGGGAFQPVVHAYPDSCRHDFYIPAEAKALLRERTLALEAGKLIKHSLMKYFSDQRFDSCVTLTAGGCSQLDDGCRDLPPSGICQWSCIRLQGARDLWADPLLPVVLGCWGAVFPKQVTCFNTSCYVLCTRCNVLHHFPAL